MPGSDNSRAVTQVQGSSPASADQARTRNAMSVDVEDYFQVSAFDGKVQRADWDELPLRLERSMDTILQLFDDQDTKATFFTLGWVAERLPQVIRQIVASGHELASHGFEHVKVHEQDRETFRSDVRRTKALLEDVGGIPVKGYRAASFSIDGRTPWAFDTLAEEGYLYSSSVYPIRHDHYGMPDAPRFGFRPEGSQGLLELPITTAKFAGLNLPCGGGGYFRLLPYSYTRWGLRRVNRRDGRACIFYFHPWELDPEQPRLPGLTRKARFRHYTNLRRMEGRLRRVLSDFDWDRVDRVFLGQDHEVGRQDRRAAL